MLFTGNMLAFKAGSKQAFELSLADVSQTQMQGKNDVLLEFHVDDATGANEVFCAFTMSWKDLFYSFFDLCICWFCTLVEC